jgi:hypothetical protein
VVTEREFRKIVWVDWSHDTDHQRAGLGCGKEVTTGELASSGSVVDSDPVFSYKFDSPQGGGKGGSLGRKSG